VHAETHNKAPNTDMAPSVNKECRLSEGALAKGVSEMVGSEAPVS
jgi:hypothetical protein